MSEYNVSKIQKKSSNTRPAAVGFVVNESLAAAAMEIHLCSLACC